MRLRSCILHSGECAYDLVDVGGSEGAVLFAEVLAQLFVELGGVDELDLALALRGLVIGQHPDVGGDAGVVEDVVRKLDDGLQVVVLDEVAADVAGTAAGIAGEEGGAVVNGGDAAAERAVREALHFAHHLHEEEELAIIHGGGGGHGLPLVLHVLQAHLEAAINNDRLATFLLQNLALVGLPALAVGRIGEHEVEAQLC